MAPEIDVIIDSPLTRVVLRNGLLATQGSVEAERDRLLEALNRYKMENELLKKLIL